MARESRVIAMKNIANSRPRPSSPAIRMKNILIGGETYVCHSSRGRSQALTRMVSAFLVEIGRQVAQRTTIS